MNATLPPTPRPRPSRPAVQNAPKRTISWTDVNFWLDALLLLVFAALCGASAIVRYAFPPGPNAAGWMLWGYDYDAWAGLQFALLAFLAVGILVHVMLHWSWVCNVIASRVSRDKKGRVDEGLQTLYGVMLLMGILLAIGAVVATAMLSIHAPQ